jgi:hypothetical protein
LCGFGVPKREFVLDVKIEDSESKSLSEDAYLAPDMAIPYDPEVFPSKFMATPCRFMPSAFVGAPAFVKDSSDEHDGKPEDQFRYGAGVRMGGVKNGNPDAGCCLEIDLVRSDAEATDGKKASLVLQEFCR